MRIELIKNKRSQHIIDNIKKSLKANQTQGVISNEDLRNKILASGYDIKGLDVALEQLAVNGRSKHLKFMEFDLAQLSKLNYKCNPDDLVARVKSLSDQERIDYSNKLLAEEGSKYFNSALSCNIKEKASANNFNEFMSAIGKEQKTLLDLYNNHKFTAQAIDAHCPGKNKMLVLTSSAFEINAIGGMDKVMKTFNYAVKHKITSQEKIMSELKRTGGNLEELHDILGRKCKNHLNSNLKAQNAQEKSQEKENKPEIKIDRGFSM